MHMHILHNCTILMFTNIQQCYRYVLNMISPSLTMNSEMNATLTLLNHTLLAAGCSGGETALTNQDYAFSSFCLKATSQLVTR